MTVRLEYKKDNSSKFWEIQHDKENNKITIRYGKIGSKGREKVEIYDYSLFRALRYVDKLIKNKIDKGYKKVRRQNNNKITNSYLIRT